MAFPVIDTAAVYLISYFWERNKKACTGKSCTGFSHGKGRSWPELVSHAPDGQDMLGIGGVFFDGVPDAVDVDGDGGCVAEGFHAPDAVVDGFPAENDIRVNHKEFKQLEFFVGKQFVFSPDGDNAGGWV